MGLPIRGALLPILGLALLCHAPGAFAQGGALKPGDVVRVTLSREPDMSGDYPVDETGHAALPLIGVRQVTGIPAERLRSEIVTAYEDQLRNQTIQVVFLRRVRVLGEVGKPGLYHVDPTMTLADAVALAGGPTREGTWKDVRIVRGETEFRADLSEPVLRHVESGDHIVVQDRGWWSRNNRYVLAFTVPIAALLVRQAIID